MPIAAKALAAPENRYLHLPGGMSLREARRRIKLENGQPWWHLVLRVTDEEWATVTFDHLEARAREPRLLDIALRDLDGLLPARAVEQESMGTAEARRLAAESPGSLVVVTRGGELAGILCTPLYGAETTGTQPGSGKKAGTDLLSARDQRQTVRRYTDVSCPDRVALETRRFSVVVRLTVERPPHDGASRALAPSPDEPVQVELQAPAFELLNDQVQEIRVLPKRDSPPVVFDLRPLRTGDHRLELEFFQGTTHLGMVSLPVEVTESPGPSRSAEAALELPACDPGIPPPDFVLRIFWTRDDQGESLRFLLLRNGGAGWEEFRPVRLDEPAEHMERLFSRLTELAAGATDEIQEELRIKGQNLWWKILPEEFRNLYTQESAGWRGRSLLIVSDEPHIPWELIWPWGNDGQDEGPWCVTLRLSRWLRRDGAGNGNAGAPGLLPLSSLACLASGQTGLPAALAEREFLRELAREHGRRFVSPKVFNRSSVTALLKTGDFDWLHLATHGSFSADAPAQESALLLEDQTHLNPEIFVGPEITRHLRQRRPAFVLNACESAQLGRGLVGIDGWASRLVSLGAGMFLGTLWPVRDSSALSLMQELYERLLTGEPVAEALRQARLAIREADDPSWLAYSLYSHPNAQVAKPPCARSS